MITIIYLKLLASAIAGQWLQILFKSSSLANTAHKGNIEYSFSWFITLDWKPVGKAFIGIALFFLVFGDLANPNHLAHQNALYTLPLGFEIPIYLIWNSFWVLCAFVFGGFGSYIGFKMQSEATKRILGAVDVKTSDADKMNNTTESPTPAAKL